MNLIVRIRQLSWKQMWNFFILFLRRPWLILPTFRATHECLMICNDRFGNAHHLSNPANAFRHALWNLLICQNVNKWIKNKQKSVFWAQKMTDLYEKVTQNEVLDEAMDRHNNMIGRIVFLNTIDQKKDKIIDNLIKMSENSIKIDELSQLKDVKNQMVYISEL